MANAGEQQGQWQEWSEPQDFFAHDGVMVEVQDARTEKKILHGRVVKHTDLLGGPGILQHGNYGLDKSGNSVVQMLAPPSLRILVGGTRKEVVDAVLRQWQEAYRNWAKDYRFRIAA